MKSWRITFILLESDVLHIYKQCHSAIALTYERPKCQVANLSGIKTWTESGNFRYQQIGLVNSPQTCLCGWRLLRSDIANKGTNRHFNLSQLATAMFCISTESHYLCLCFHNPGGFRPRQNHTLDPNLRNTREHFSRITSATLTEGSDKNS